MKGIDQADFDQAKYPHKVEQNGCYYRKTAFLVKPIYNLINNNSLRIYISLLMYLIY